MVSSNEMAGASGGEPLAGVRVLVADDSAANRRFIAWCLEKAGAKVDVVEDGTGLLGALTVPGEAGASLIAPEPADVVLTDVEMPVIDGLTATRLLRRLGCRLPIVALTARTESGDADECLGAGCDAFSSKPIEAEALLSLVANLLNRPGGAAGEPGAIGREPDAAAGREPGGSGSAVEPAEAPGSDATKPEETLRSELADDPDMVELVESFVGGLAETVEKIEAALSAEQTDELARLVHQLKGAGGSYGFPAITQTARDAEAAIRSGAGSETVAAGIARLTGLCRAAMRTPQAPPRPEARSA